MIDEIDKLMAKISRKRRSRIRRRKTKFARRFRKLNHHTHDVFEDVHMFKQEIARPEVVLGVYGSEDWVFADFLRNRFLSKMQTLDVSSTWITPVEFRLARWVVDMKFETFTFFHSTKVVVQQSDGLLTVNSAKGKIDVSLIGSVAFCAEWEKYFDDKFKRAENLIEWVYNARGDSTSVPLNYRPALKTAYPWLNKDLNEYIEEFLNSSANVLILIGQPGTGKTTFIKNIIHRAGGDAKVAYDEKVLNTDDFFAGFIEDDCRFLVMEDADAFLSARQDGNSMMHKFLNVSDGLVSAADKKLVFSTNLPNIRDIDSALLREGRCFDVLQFRALTRDESKKVYEEAGVDKELPDGNEFTLAELFNTQLHQKKTTGIGFI